MNRIFRLLPVTIVTVFTASSASTNFMPYAAPSTSAPHVSGIRAKGFNAGGSDFRGMQRGRRNLPQNLRPGDSSLRGGASSWSMNLSGKAATRGVPFAVRHIWGATVPGHMRSHHRQAPQDADLHTGTRGISGANAFDGEGLFNQGAHLTLASIGSITRETYNGHTVRHKVLGYRHSVLAGFHFTKPGDHLQNRLARLRGHRWHRHFKHLVITGFAGAAFCDLYCEFDVPEGVYGDFLVAASESGPEESEAVALAELDAALANVPRAERPRQMVAKAHGWNKAVAILEASVADDDRKAMDAKGTGGEGGAVIDQADERVDVAIDRGNTKKASQVSLH